MSSPASTARFRSSRNSLATMFRVATPFGASRNLLWCAVRREHRRRADDVKRLPANLATMKQAYRRPPPRVRSRIAALVELGRAIVLRSDDIRRPARPPARAAIRPMRLGRRTNRASKGDSGQLTQRKTQTLLGIGHARAAIRLGRPPRDARGAGGVGDRHRLDVDVHDCKRGKGRRTSWRALRGSDTYAAKFRRALPGAAINLDTIVIALAAFERTIEPEEAPFDRWIAGDETGNFRRREARLRPVQRARPIARPATSGWRFTDDEFHDIGTTTTDRGRGREMTESELMQFAFKTPTLRSVALRAPYMHDGSIAKRLRDVVESLRRRAASTVRAGRR